VTSRTAAFTLLMKVKVFMQCLAFLYGSGGARRRQTCTFRRAYLQLPSQ
jgi:hypothetical protein